MVGDAEALAIKTREIIINPERWTMSINILERFMCPPIALSIIDSIDIDSHK
jgi:hypothetical protein